MDHSKLKVCVKPGCLLIILLSGLISCNNESDVSTPSLSDTSSISERREKGLDKLNYTWLFDGKFRTEPGFDIPLTNRKDMAATFDYLHKNKKDSSIVIYFHGGFIPIQNAYRQPLTKGFDTAFRNGAHFPYYVLYGNGAGNTIWVYLRNKFFNHEDGNEEFMETGNPTFEDSLEQLFKKQSFIYIIGQTNRKFSSNDGIRSKDYIPYDTTNLEETVLAELNKESFTGTLDKSYLNDSTADKLFEKQLYSDKKLQNLAKADYLEEQKNFAPDSIAGFNFVKALYNIVMISKGVRYRIKNNRHHDPRRMTIIEETFYNATYLLIKFLRWSAKAGWDESKSIVSKPFINKENYGGTALLEELSKMNEAAKLAGKNKNIWLVGSSTGTIMICELLKASKRPEFSNLRFNIIFAVASCTMKLFGEALDSAKDKIDSFYMFGLSDKYERVREPSKLFWPGSILLFVSSVCEADDNSYHDKPLVGMQRYYLDEFTKKATLDSNEKKQLKRVIDFFKMKNSYSSTVIWSNDPGTIRHPGLDNKATFHGGVMVDSAVQASITYLLKQSNQR